MIDSILLNCWSRMIGAEDQLKALGPDRISAARDLFRELAKIKNDDELRRRLTVGNQPPAVGAQAKSAHEFPRQNHDLALLVLAESISCAREGRSDAKGLWLVGWLLLIGQYGKSNLLRAHGKLLEGLFHQSNNYEAQAKTSFQESLQCYGYEPAVDAEGPKSVCFYCLGVMSVNCDEFGEASSYFQRAQNSANEAKLKDLEWAKHIQREIEASVSQRLVVDALVKAPSEADVREAVRRHKEIVGDRTIQILRVRSFRSSSHLDVQGAVASASAADWVAKSLNKESCVRRDLGETNLHVNRYGIAEAVLKAILAEFPNDIDAQRKLGHCLFLQGKYEEAKGILEKVVGPLPHDASVLRELGIVHIHLKQPDLARRYLKAALVKDPSDYLAKEALENIGASDVQPVMAFDKESGTLTISGDMPPGADMGMMILATLLKANPGQSQQILNDVAKTEGPAYAQRVNELAFPSPPRKSEPSHFDKAQELFRARRYSDALKEYKFAIDADRDHALAYMGAGDCFYHLGQLNLATAFFEESIAIQPHPSTLRFLGDAHRKSGRTDEAIRAYEQALELNPNYEIARQQLSLMRKQ